MSSPLVSVVVITYNSLPFVIETLESIKNQLYQNIELIISDDCSTDDTFLICKNWIDKNSSRFVNCQVAKTAANVGIPGNCNQGFDLAKGEWIKLIAGDDYLLNNCITDYVDYINKNTNSAIVYSEAIKIDENSNILPVNTAMYIDEIGHWRNYFFKQSVEVQLKYYVRDPIFLISPTIFINKATLIALGGFDDSLRVYEDIVVIIKLLRAGNKIDYFSKETVAYRIHSGSISKSKNKEKELRNLSELSYIYKNYRKPLLKNTNVLDLNSKFIAWLQFDYTLKYKLKGARFFQKFNLFKLYQRLSLYWYKD